MKRVLFVTDLDGTLLKGDETISEKSVDIIFSLIQQGILFTYATARAYSSAQRATEKLRLNVPVATYNGAIIINPTDKSILETCFIDKSTIDNIIDLLSSVPIRPIVYSLGDKNKEIVSWMSLCDTDSSGILSFITSRNLEITLQRAYSVEQLLSGDIYYLASIGNEENARRMECLFNDIDGLSFTIQEDSYQDGLYWFEAFNKDATKEKSIQKLKKHVNADKVVCFGDNLNDISMFQAADYSIAVANAYPKLKEIANDITLTNDLDGVATWLLRNAKSFAFE